MDPVLPTIGSSGAYELRSPLDTLVTTGERYTCQGIRRISDYLANNEDVKQDVYVSQGIEAEYDADAESDAYIVSLQSAKGHWLYIPARYIITYPIVNGIPYRTVMMGLSLPSIPVTQDISFLETEIENIISDTLGVVPVIKQVETSRVVLVSKDRHDIVQMERNALSANRLTDRTRYMSLLQDHQLALQKIALLEQYIKDNFVP